MNEIKYFSMFTGVGGFELGISNTWNDNGSNRQTGEFKGVYSESDKSKSSVRCIGFSEIDKYANQLLAKRFPNIPNFGDCTKINADELPDFDMLCGGFPCQSFSIAGKRRGFEDTRGTMFFEVARIIKVKRPKIVFLENVKGLLNHNKGETFSVILQTLDELGYEVQWMVLNSKFFGVPQNRERVFIIGSLRGQPRPEILPFRADDQKTAELQTQQNICNTRTRRYEQAQATGSYIAERKQYAQGSQGYRVYSTEGTSTTLAGQAGGIGAKTGLYAIPVLTPNRENKRQNGRRFKENGDESFTLTKTDIHGVAIMDLYNNKEHTDRSPTLTEPHHNTLRVREGFKIRRLTPTECERLQGFPDGWTEGFSDTQRYKMMGNAVTVNVIKAIASKLLDDTKNTMATQ
jgi:DNA (cytosine-5)-methyltransferase 1